jgi:methionine sulfoxide reductase heme-binding subunit
VSGEHFFWITSRAAGIAALLLASAAVGLGLALGGRLTKARSQDLRPLHEALSLATLAALAVHAVALLGDGFLHPSVADITVPFASSYQRLWQTVGIIAGWMLLALGLSFYARARIGVQRWRSLHRWTALAWLLSIGHSLGEGTDAGRVWFLAAVGMVVLPTLWLLIERHAAALTVPAGAGPAVPDPARPVAPPTPAPRASEASSLWRG